jgi:isoquinoline 1-oxidoreductase beta subunit
MTKMDLEEAVKSDEGATSGGGISCSGVSRRSFLIGTASVAFGVAFGGTLAGMGKAFAATSSGASGAAATFSPGAWMQVATDGTVTIMSAAAEMGQGVMTAMPLLIAEEMDLDWSKVRVRQAPFDPKTYGNPAFGGAMTTGASRTTKGYYEILRLAGLQARQILMLTAAQHWGVPVSQLSTEPHHVVHKASGRRLGYGEIAAFAQVPTELPKVSKEQLKPMSQFRLIGQDVPRVDVPDKATGKANFGIDTQLPGMLYATVQRAPVQGEKPLKVDDSAALKIPGVVKVVSMPYGVGVVADSYWAARKARNVLKVQWSDTAAARKYSSDEVAAQYAARAQDLESKGVEFIKTGDAPAAMAKAVRTFAAGYTSEHVAHATMEPMNATARVNGDKIEVWAPTQSPTIATLVLKHVLGYSPENVNIHMTLLGGGFGRRVEADYILDAAILAKSVPGKPVKVVWSREDDVQSDKFRPLVAQHLVAGVDEQGRIIALRHRIVGESIYARVAPPVFAKAGGKDAPVCDGSDINYDVPDHLVEYMREQRGVDVGFWRAVGPGYTKFALETLIDEIAEAHGKDPIDYRLVMLEKHPRAQAVMQAAAQMADWKRKRPAGRALGFAYSDHWQTHCAQVAEVSVDARTGKIRVHEVWAAVDSGVALQPKNIEAQVESSIIYGISQTLNERITLKSGEVQQSNYHNYSVLRMSEVPLIHVKVMPTDNYPGGMGEVGLPPISGAIANAVARLTGKRLRTLPLDQGLLKA